MKQIVFTMKNGEKIGFAELTGIPLKTENKKRLQRAAKTAMEVDSSIQSYQIVDQEAP